MDRALWLGAAQCVSWGVLFYSFGLVLPAMGRELSGSPTLLSGAFSAALLVTMIVSLRVGRWVDAGRERAVFLGGIAIGAGALALWAASRSLLQLFLAMLGLGVAMALTLYEPAFALVNRWHQSNSERNRALTIVTLLGALAGPIFVPILGFAITEWGWRAAIAGGAAALVAPGLIYGRLLGRRVVVLSVAPTVGRFPRELWWLGAAAFLSSFGATTLAVHLPTYLIGRGDSLAVPAGVIAAMGLAQFPARLVIAQVATRWGASRVFAAALTIQAAAIGAVVVFESPVALGLAGAVFGAGNGAATILRAVGARQHAGSSGYGTAVGRLGAFAVGARAAAPVTAGALAASFSPSIPFLVSSALLLGCSLIGFAMLGDAPRDGL